jgi:hypothetical protein
VVPVHISAVVAGDVVRHLDVEFEAWLVQVLGTSMPAARFGGARVPRNDEKVDSQLKLPVITDDLYQVGI